MLTNTDSQFGGSRPWAEAETSDRSPPKRRSPFGGGKRAEAEVFRRLDAGQSTRKILAETGIAPTIVDRAVRQAMDTEFMRRRRNQRDASIALREAIFNEAAKAQNDRVSAAPHSRSEPEQAHSVLRFPLRQLLDVRPLASGRDPCGYCGTRGDVGCKHQRRGQVRSV